MIPITKEKLDEIKVMFNDLINEKIGSFQILNPGLVPEGLKLIARSVSWLVEQIVVQNLRKNKDQYNLRKVIDPPHNLTQYDCILQFNDDPKKYHINIKTSLIQTSGKSRFDISKGPKLVGLYSKDPNYILLIAIIKIDIKNVMIKFHKSIVFNIAWLKDIYYNRANHNLQTKVDEPIIRENEEFVEILAGKIREKGHTIHY